MIERLDKKISTRTSFFVFSKSFWDKGANLCVDYFKSIKSSRQKKLNFRCFHWKKQIAIWVQLQILYQWLKKEWPLDNIFKVSNWLAKANGRLEQFQNLFFCSQIANGRLRTIPNFVFRLKNWIAVWLQLWNFVSGCKKWMVVWAKN